MSPHFLSSKSLSSAKKARKLRSPYLLDSTRSTTATPL
jgi:hypothetical protein